MGMDPVKNKLLSWTGYLALSPQHVVVNSTLLIAAILLAHSGLPRRGAA